MKYNRLKTLIFAMAVCASGAVSGAETLPESLELIYEVSLGGAELGSLSSTLIKKPDYYEVTSETRAEGMASILLGGTVREVCRFNVTERTVNPEHYRIVREGIDAFDRSVSFDLDQRKVIFDDGTDMTIPSGYIVDSCSAPFAFMLGGAPAFEGTTWHIVGGKRVRQFENLSITSEQVSTPLGDFDTLRIEQIRFERPDRRLTLWLATEQENLPVKIVEQRTSRPDTVMVLKSMTGL